MSAALSQAGEATLSKEGHMWLCEKRGLVCVRCVCGVCVCWGGLCKVTHRVPVTVK